MNSISERLMQVRDRISIAARHAGRAPETIRLVGVSKTHPSEYIQQALEAGLSDFGENRVQEAETKIAELADDHGRITWHLIGHLQSNKARRAATLFDIIHSVDSWGLAQTLDRHVQRLREPSTELVQHESRAQAADNLAWPTTIRLPVLLQVNVSGEASKEGFALAGWEEQPAVLEAFFTDVERMLALPYLDIRGLMTIAPWSANPEAARPTFRSARRLRDALAQRFSTSDWSELSMGMTDDFEIAVAEGATIVRVGRAIFGERTPG